ncbi:MAG: WecB/TagA/CpsF family glycosyltransferase [Oceanospirillaceae bacterium]
MKSQTHSLETTRVTLKREELISASLLPRLFALVLVVFISPIVVTNLIIAFFKGNTLLFNTKKQDALGRTVLLHAFSGGFFRKSAWLFDIVNGHLSFTGVPLTHSLKRADQYEIRRKFLSTPGIFSLFDLHKSSGLAVANEKQLLIQQLNASVLQNAGLIIRSILCLCLYSRNTKKLNDDANITLFGLNITNSTISEAVDWVTSASRKASPNIGFYVNANSINLGLSTPAFLKQLQQADALFADGSGMRMAAKSAGYQLKDNNNGTDMLPHLCCSCVSNQKSIFLLGAKPGVAQQAADNLTNQYPQLQIAGVQHGYTSPDKADKLIAQINDSRCDILLVAFGSPIQEAWVLKHRSALKCHTILAVGGLFDFYSGEISRSPMWLRELGLEWVWRLIKEPKSKFYRYVIGNPLFLFRIHVLGLASKGARL